MSLLDHCSISSPPLFWMPGTTRGILDTLLSEYALTKRRWRLEGAFFVAVVSSAGVLEKDVEVSSAGYLCISCALVRNSQDSCLTDAFG